MLDLAGGAVGTLTASFDVYGGDVPFTEIYGSEGTLSLPDPNTFGGTVGLRRAGEKTFSEQALQFPYDENSRGVGVADLAAAIGGDRPHRASGEMAAHVLDLMISFHEASEGGRHVELGSRMQRPAAFPTGLRTGGVE